MFYPTFMHLFITLLHVCRTFTASIEQNSTGSVDTYPSYICYKCFFDECDNPYNVTCNDGVSCFTHTEIIDGTLLYREKGCLKLHFIALAYCYLGMTKYKENGSSIVSTCCRGNFCNDDEFEMPSIPEVLITSPAPTTQEKQIERINSKRAILANDTHAVYIVALSFFIVLAIFVLGMTYIIVNRRAASHSKVPYGYPKLHCKPTSDSAFVSVYTSGSGSGKHSLNQRCIAQDVDLIKCIGQGRYGAVWQGRLQGENVAVKLFSSVDSASWNNEVNIYTNLGLYHENVLGFKGSTVTSRFGVTELWLLTTYHEKGSLYDYLLDNPISLEQMIVFVRSACAGLLHLHTEIFELERKPPIAHRDLKTRNILITSHGTCVLADFGLSVVKCEDSSKPNYPENYKVGTKRYMAPEVLDDTMKSNSFESYKQADIYSFGLVMWEVCSRSTVKGIKETFRLAFHDCVPSNPDFEDMKQVVCIDLKRPDIPDKWLSNEALNDMAQLMKQCWHKRPEVRYTASRVKKNLDKIYAKIQKIDPSIQTV